MFKITCPTCQTPIVIITHGEIIGSSEPYYAAGSANDDGASYGMFDGPTNNLEELEAHAHPEETGRDAFIFRFTEQAPSERIKKWGWESAQWEDFCEP
jgi:hypothetical protein